MVAAMPRRAEGKGLYETHRVTKLGPGLRHPNPSARSSWHPKCSKKRDSSKPARAKGPLGKGLNLTLRELRRPSHLAESPVQLFFVCPILDTHRKIEECQLSRQVSAASTTWKCTGASRSLKAPVSYTCQGSHRLREACRDSECC